jgi:hypothetical protein
MVRSGDGDGPEPNQKPLRHIRLHSGDDDLVSSAVLRLVQGSVGGSQKCVNVSKSTCRVAWPSGRGADADGHNPVGGIAFMRNAQILN